MLNAKPYKITVSEAGIENPRFEVREAAEWARVIQSVTGSVAVYTT